MKKDRIPTLLQGALSRFIQQNMHLATFGALTTITHVQVNADLNLAKVYLSFITTGRQVDEATLLSQVEKERYKLKRYLACELGHKLRIMPDVEFYIDNTAKKAVEIERLFSKL